MKAGLKSPDMIVKIRSWFCKLLLPDLLFIGNSCTGEKIPVIPGALRDRDVEVGRHIALSPSAVPRFLERLHKAYAMLIGTGYQGSVVSSAWSCAQ